ncbi:metallophosphoesterase [Paenibacillus hodogayensis]|uniref:Metallophosphoesterase n=1 Tax=Paenibacillus hodogayensis TaxID=279208 RepID=A0ABV5W3A1_9BACL
MNRRTFLKRSAAAAFMAVVTAGGLWNYRLNAPRDTEEDEADAFGDLPHGIKGERAEIGNPNDGSGAALSFFVLSDLHVNSGVATPGDNLRRAFDDMLAFESKIQAVLITGDVTESGTDKDYAQFRSIMKDYKLPPVYANMGNHDYYRIWINKAGAWSKETAPNGMTDASSREAFMKHFRLDKPYSEVLLNGCRVLLLSQEAYVQEKPEVIEGAWYSDEQLAWLKDRLAERQDRKPAFVMIHQPLPAIGQNGGTHSLIRAKEFRDILKPHPNVFVFSGHTHQDLQNGREHYIKETFHWFHNSSVGRVLDVQYQPLREHVAQGLYVQVFADKVVVRGREFIGRSWIKEASWTVKLV